MGISLIIIMSIIFVHFVADFVLQTHWQATNKSKNNKALTAHVLTYSVSWLIPITFMWENGQSVYWYVIHSLAFVGITFVCHWITDYFTSRLNSILYAKGDIHNFFVSVGFDQVLHYAQLFSTYLILRSI